MNYFQQCFNVHARSVSYLFLTTFYIISESQSGIPDSGLKTVQNWLKPETSSKFGQLSSVAFDVYGNVVVFHRGDRTWNGFTFDR